MGSPQPARIARTRVQRRGLWIVLALLVLLPVAVCQAASSPAPVDPPLAVAGSCDGDHGPDVLCVRAVAATAPSPRAGRDHGGPDGPGILVAILAAGAVVTMAARYRRTAGPPPWAPQRLVGARHQLVALGITRI